MNSDKLRNAPANEAIRARREALGLSDVDVARRAGLSIHEYGDLEQHGDEVFSVAHLAQVRRVCEVLQLDLAELLGIRCPSCYGSVRASDRPAKPRHLLIARRRQELNLTPSELAHRLGVAEDVIRQMEGDADLLEGWPVEFVQDVARELGVPLHALIEPACKALS